MVETSFFCEDELLLDELFVYPELKEIDPWFQAREGYCVRASSEKAKVFIIGPLAS